MKKLIVIFVSAVFFFSCNKEEVSALKSLNALEGKWDISQVDLSKLSKEFKLTKINGTVDFIYCKVKLDLIKSPNYLCEGAAKFNNKSFFLTYKYDDATKILKLFVSPQEIGTEEEQNIAFIMSGDWKIDNSTNTFTAIRQPNTKVSDISFTAKK